MEDILMSDEKNPQLALTFPDFCARVGISTRLLYSMIARGEGPPTIKLGRRSMIRPEAGMEWLKNLESTKV